jgi:hypothetical protein
VEHTAGTARLAFEGGFGALERRLDRYREREGGRRPKKYFAAKRLTEGLRAPAGRSRRARRERPHRGRDGPSGSPERAGPDRRATTPVVSVYLDTRWTDAYQQERARSLLRRRLTADVGRRRTP